MKNSFLTLVVMLFAALLLGTAPAPAQEEENLTEAERQLLNHYYAPTLENLARLYWKLGKFSIKDYKAIDHYLMITECEIYQRYYNSDVEWATIREATKEHLNNDAAKFSRRFIFIVEIDIGRYDVKSEAFELPHANKFNARTKIDLSYNDSVTAVCGYRGRIEGYPRNMAVILDSPISLPYLPVDKQMASEYLNHVKEHPHIGRKAYLELKITAQAYKEDTAGTDGHLVALVFSQLDKLTIYADGARRWKLYEQDFTEIRDRNKKN